MTENINDGLPPWNQEVADDEADVDYQGILSAGAAAKPMNGKPKQPKKPFKFGFGQIKLGKKKWLIIGVGVLLLTLAGAGSFFLVGPTKPGPVATPTRVVRTPTAMPTTVGTPKPDQTPAAEVPDHPFAFKVPVTRAAWTLAWFLGWGLLALLLVFFRAEANRRGELWDFNNTSLMLLGAGIVMILAKGLMVMLADACSYWLLDECPMGSLTVEMIENGGLIICILAAVTVSFGGLVASVTGQRDFTPWAVATFGVGFLAKLLLATAFIQTLASAVMFAGLVIFTAEVGGAAKGKLAIGGLVSVGVSLLLLAVATPLLAMAIKRLALDLPRQWLWLATPVIENRLLLGLLLGWAIAMAVAYGLTPSVAPQLQRLGTGSIVVGDAEKVDAAIYLLMVISMIVVFGWLPVIAALV